MGEGKKVGREGAGESSLAFNSPLGPSRLASLAVFFGVCSQATCRRTICRTCPHINQSTSLLTPGELIKITGHFTCITENIISCISCRKCSETVYIGDTGRRLADRFREHRLDVLHSKGDSFIFPSFFNPCQKFLYIIFKVSLWCMVNYDAYLVNKPMV